MRGDDEQHHDDYEDESISDVSDLVLQEENYAQAFREPPWSEAASECKYM